MPCNYLMCTVLYLACRHTDNIIYQKKKEGEEEREEERERERDGGGGMRIYSVCLVTKVYTCTWVCISYTLCCRITDS